MMHEDKGNNQSKLWIRKNRKEFGTSPKCNIFSSSRGWNLVSGYTGGLKHASRCMEIYELADRIAECSWRYISPTSFSMHAPGVCAYDINNIYPCRIFNLRTIFISITNTRTDREEIVGKSFQVFCTHTPTLSRSVHVVSNSHLARRPNTTRTFPVITKLICILGRALVEGWQVSQNCFVGIPGTGQNELNSWAYIMGKWDLEDIRQA